MSIVAAETGGAPATLNDTAAISGGYLIIISVEAIRERAPARWPMKQDSVWDFAERQFKKDFPRADIMQRLSDTEYLIAQSQETGHAAQHKAINLLKQINTFFLGSSPLSGLKVSVVKSVDGGVFEAEPLTPEQIAAIDEGPAPASEPEPSSKAHPPSQLTIAIDGDRQLEILVLIEPIWNLSKQAVASYYLRPLVFEVAGSRQIPAALQDLSLRDLMAMDLAMVRNAAMVLKDAQSAGFIFALHTPLHFRCLRSLSCRAEFARLLPSVADFRKLLVFCILGVPEGAPQGGVSEAIAAVRPHSHGVIVQAQALNGEVLRWRSVGLSGVSYDFSDEDQDDPELIKRLEAFAANAKSVIPTVIGHAIGARPVLLAAWGAGFTHISGRLITDKFPETRSAVRFPALKIYSAL